MDVYSIMMQSPVAIVIFKGADYTVAFANDFYLQILGKGKDIVGKPLFESFPELINQGIDTLIDNVMVSGMPHVINEHEAQLMKDGQVEQHFFNCTYQPFREQNEGITGVIVVFTEVTELVIAKNANRLNEEKLSIALSIANIELAFQDDEKEKRAEELIIANKELAFQDDEKEKRAEELIIANKELAFQDKEKGKRAEELVIANKELVFQNEEKGKRAEELVIANKELVFQNKEKGKRAEELVIANKELVFQNKEKGKRAEELVIANKELVFQNNEKWKRAEELDIANKEKWQQEIANKKLEAFSSSVKLVSQYSRSLIEASLDPLVTISADGKITDVNEASIKVTGIGRDKLIGTDFSNYFTEPQKAQEGYRQVFEKGFVADYPLTITHKNGKLTDVLYNASVYKDDKGNVLGVFAAARDITEQKRIATELIEAKVFAESATKTAEEAKTEAENATEIAKDAVKAKQQFLSNMSHEIRTPMNAIIGFTKVVLKTDLSVKQKEYLTAIKTSGDALIVLINDILDLAKVDAGKMTFEKTPFKLKLSIAAMLHLFETKIQEKNLQLVKKYDNNIPEVLIGDPVRLHQIILNLVSNAVKFTAVGHITVNVSLLSEDAEQVTIEFAVTDTGIGISEEKMPNVFDNFQQASSNTARLFGGTGLGLAIVKQLVEPQGGTINVKSTLGEGTTFSFTLSFQKTDATAEMQTEITELDEDIKSIKILVVEDILLNQLLMKTLLDDFGFERDIAENGRVAIDMLTKKDAYGATKVYDIILMDLQMPEMNGFEATEYIRNTLKSNIPIIALTADVTTVDVAKCKAVGMNDYIAKPIDERVLYNKIVGLVKKNVVKQSDKVVETEEKVRYTNLTYLKKLTKSNSTLMIDMILAYLAQTPPLIQAMRQSFHEEDWQLLHSAVHKMIPSFLIIGMHTDFETMAKKVVEYARMSQKEDNISDFVFQLENVCLRACAELEEELTTLRKI